MHLPSRWMGVLHVMANSWCTKGIKTLLQTLYFVSMYCLKASTRNPINKCSSVHRHYRTSFLRETFYYVSGIWEVSEGSSQVQRILVFVMPSEETHWRFCRISTTGARGYCRKTGCFWTTLFTTLKILVSKKGSKLTWIFRHGSDQGLISQSNKIHHKTK